MISNLIIRRTCVAEHTLPSSQIVTVDASVFTKSNMTSTLIIGYAHVQVVSSGSMNYSRL
jgi:hypothetical protein